MPVMKNSTILAIETATQSCSVALYSSQKLYQRQRVAPKEHNNLLLPMVQSLLNEGGIGLDDLDYISVSLGPGSFVGTRLGVSVAQSLAYAAKVPVFGFSSLSILAHSIVSEIKPEAMVIPLLDAQLGGVYWSCFEPQGQELVETVPSSLSPSVEFQQKVSLLQGNVLIAGPALPKSLCIESCGGARWLDGVYPNAKDVITLTLNELEAGSKAINPLEIEPLYLRHQVAEPQKTPVTT
jgi:tRNA threonylcarbamoyladenosine biosynthesis protein TsaB